jgi:hypothetical protein
MVVAQTSEGGVGLELYDRKSRSASEIAIERALLKSSGMRFDGVELNYIVKSIASDYKIPIQIDRVALEDAGLGLDEPVTMDLEGVSLRSALRHMLRPINLTYIVRDEVMLITTPNVADEYLETRAYEPDVNQSLSIKNFEVFAAMIVKHVRPGSWAGDTFVPRRQGGFGAGPPLPSPEPETRRSGPGVAEVSAIESGLVITQTYEGHEKVRDLLKQLGWQAAKQE